MRSCHHTIAMFVAVATIATAQVSLAAPIAVPNFSFENPATGNFASPAANWTGAAAGDGVAFGSGANGFTSAAAGTQFGFLNTGFSGNAANSFTSSASLGSVSAGTYTLTAALGRRSDAISNGAAPTSYTLELLSNGTSFSSASFDPSGYSLDSWNDETMISSLSAGDAAVGGALTIRLTATGGNQGQYDNVRMDFVAAPDPTPEPTALALAGIGVMGLGVHRRRRTRS